MSAFVAFVLVFQY